MYLTEMHLFFLSPPHTASSLMTKGYLKYLETADIPTIQIYGAYYPSLVFEGDVDGDGKDEWGTLSTGMNSQWRLYSIYNYDNKTKKWRYLYDDEGGLDQLLMNDLVEVKRT